jgi:hypothetical protein
MTPMCSGLDGMDIQRKGAKDAKNAKKFISACGDY